MSSLRVAILKSRLGKKGGLEKYTYRILEGLLQRQCKVTLLASEPSTQPLDASIVSFQGPKWPGFRRLEAFDKSASDWIKKNSPDIVLGLDRNRLQTHIRAGNGVHAAYLEKRFETEGLLKKWICKCNPLHQKVLEIEKAGFENPLLKKIFTNSHMVKEEIARFYKPYAQIEVIHNGVEWQEMARPFSEWQTEKQKWCSTQKIDPDLFHFLFVGNGYLRKGLDALLLALSGFEKKRFFLSVVGKEKNEEKYRRLIKKYGLEENVRLFGPQQSILPFYQAADALVIPSWYDPFANVTVEALAMGLFVISSKNNGGSEIVSCENGSVIPDLHDKASFHEILKDAMRKKKEAKSSLSVRKSVEYLDFSKQMTHFIDRCLS
jgi:UDP-glucose:(heptosyl)LPS alpha-1,3-glucosyltransferase